MSLPYPSSSSPSFSSYTKRDYEEMEPALMALASKSRGDLRKLLFSFFAFLNQRTDFYVVPPQEDVIAGVCRMGFKEGDAEKLLLAAFRQFPLRRMPSKKKMNIAGSNATGGNATVPAIKKKKSNVKKAETGDSSLKENDTDSNKNKAVKNDSFASSDSKNEITDENNDCNRDKSSTEKIRLTDEGKQIPIGNGGICKRYQWTQSSDELNVVLAVPEGTRAKHLSVSLNTSSVSISFKERPTEKLLDGTFFDKIRKDESTWSLEGSALLLTLDKLKHGTWWETIIQGDEIIDTSLVDSTRNISDYDEITQGQIRKILFDQRQERLGKPSSDEILGKGKKDGLPKGVEFIDKQKLDDFKRDMNRKS